jgi:hypothetical protein
MEDEMRHYRKAAGMFAIAIGVAFAAPVSAETSGATHHKQRIHLHAVEYRGFSSTATALAPTRTVIPLAPAVKTDGLSRNPDDCNYGCIDNN